MATTVVAEDGHRKQRMVPVEIAPDGDRPRRADRDGVIEIVFGCGARVRLRGGVSSKTLPQVIELLR
jgi:hypothetical protein